MPAFVPGLALNADFYTEVVGPQLKDWPHTAARIGDGSDVLGFDAPRSTDHGWGPQLTVFVDAALVPIVQRALDSGLPDTYREWPVRFGWDDVPVDHHVTVTTLSSWLVEQLGVDASAGLDPTDWLLMPQQKLLQVTKGGVYRDDDGELTRTRQALAWYPDDIWRWMIAAQWRRIAQEEAFVGRTAEAGDDLGSRLVASRLGRELMRTWFLLARAYWPYTKWFGSAFSQLPESSALGAAIGDAVGATNHAAREAALVTAYQLVAECHNQLGLTDVVDPSPRPFYARPWRVLMADRFVEASLAALGDSWLCRLPLVGSIDQVADSADLLSDGARSRSLAALYRP